MASKSAIWEEVFYRTMIIVILHSCPFLNFSCLAFLSVSFYFLQYGCVFCTNSWITFVSSLCFLTSPSDPHNLYNFIIPSSWFLFFFFFKSKYPCNFQPVLWKLVFLKDNSKISVCVHVKNSPYSKTTKFKMIQSMRFTETGWCSCSKFDLVSPYFSTKRGKKSHSE